MNKSMQIEHPRPQNGGGFTLKARDSFIQHVLYDTPSLGCNFTIKLQFSNGENDDDYEPWDHGMPNLQTNVVDGFYGDLMGCHVR